MVGNPFVCDDNLKWFTEYLTYEISNNRWFGKKDADEVYADPIICPDPLEATTVATKETCHCTCSNNA
uniref:Lipase_3 domain-containing protein n=1 Tax=Panagrellus redivivus TaxID=6233 RepID=A0A7E5A1W4_PANRE